MTSAGAHPAQFGSQGTNFARWTVVTAFLVTFFVAALIRSPLLFLMASTLMALSLIALLIRFIGLDSLHCDLSCPHRVNEGELVYWTARLHNRGRFPVIWLSVTVEPDPWGEFVDPPDSGREFVINPGEDLELRGTQRFHLRGLRCVGTVRLSAEDPLGLVRVERSLPLSPPLLVLPARIAFHASRDWWGGRTVAEEARDRPSRSDGGEFHGTREYQPGDPLRRIHWKWTAHLNSFRVIEFADTLERDLTILLDLNQPDQAGTGKESTLEYAVTLAASAAEALVLRGIHVRLHCAAPGAEELERWRGSAFLPALLNFLARVEPIPETESGRTVTRCAERAPLDSSILIISAAPREQVVALSDRLRRPGRLVRVLWLDAATFAGGGYADIRAGSAQAGEVLLPVQRGDNLARLLEGLP